MNDALAVQVRQTSQHLLAERLAMCDSKLILRLGQDTRQVMIHVLEHHEDGACLERSMQRRVEMR